MEENTTVEATPELPYRVAIGTNSKGGAQVSVRVEALSADHAVQQAIKMYAETVNQLQAGGHPLAG